MPRKDSICVASAQALGGDFVLVLFRGHTRLRRRHSLGLVIECVEQVAIGVEGDLDE